MQSEPGVEGVLVGGYPIRTRGDRRDKALAIRRTLRALPRTIHKLADGLFRNFELRGVELAEVAAELGAMHCAWSNASILAFFWEQHERRLAVCMLAHGRLGQESMWGGLDEEMLRMVLGNKIHYGGA